MYSLFFRQKGTFSEQTDVQFVWKIKTGQKATYWYLDVKTIGQHSTTTHKTRRQQHNDNDNDNSNTTTTITTTTTTIQQKEEKQQQQQ